MSDTETAGTGGEAAGPEAPAGGRSTLTFTEGCAFTRAADGTVAVAWDNGLAVRAVKGASVDYIDPKYHMCVRSANNVITYLPAKDLGSLLASGVEAKLAMVIVGMRRVMTSFPDVEFNLAELKMTGATDADGVIPEAAWNALQAQTRAYNAALDATATICGLNGISVLNKGHHYLADDSMWSRLEAALNFEETMTSLGIANYDGLLFHDCLHPISLEWKVEAVTQLNSPLIGHVNGVLLKRIPGVPAGTALVFVTQAAIEEVSVARPAIKGVFEDLKTAIDELARTIRASPLDWCIMLQRVHTARNLARVTAMEDSAALIFGVCKVVFTSKSTILKSQAFKNNAARHAAMVTVGTGWATELADPTYGDETIRDLLSGTVRRIANPA